jgi:hypothetical protein
MAGRVWGCMIIGRAPRVRKRPRLPFYLQVVGRSECEQNCRSRSSETFQSVEALSFCNASAVQAATDRDRANQ